MSKIANSTLPNELWTRVLNLAQGESELPEAWMSYRFVCSAFRTAIESIFRDRHLRKTWIRIKLGEAYDEHDRIVVLDLDFAFSHLSEDKCIAVFRADECEGELRETITRRLKGCALDNIDMPQHYVQVHRELNDTPIPGLSIDYEKLELSCDWKGLFTRFFGEEMLYHRYQAAWVEERKDWATNMGRMAVRGQLDMMQVIESAVHAFAGAAEDSRAKARRARQRRLYQERGEEFRGLSEPVEKALVEEIAKIRQLTSMEHDSDYDDDGEYEEEEEEGGKESDGWQTDDGEGDDEDDGEHGPD